MKELLRKNKIVLTFIIVLLFIGFTFTSVKAVKSNNDNSEINSNLISFEQSFSEPVFETIGENLLSVSVKEAEYNSAIQSRPILPTFVKNFELPWGSHITDIFFNIQVLHNRFKHKISISHCRCQINRFFTFC